MSLSLPDLPPLPSEALLIDVLCTKSYHGVKHAIVLSPGRGQSAWSLAERYPRADVVAWFVDSHRAAKARRSTVGTVRIVCSSDLPEQMVDLALLPVLKNGEAEMNRELLQQAHQRLRVGGTLIASVNAPDDQWLLKQMQAVFDKVHCRRLQSGCVYFGKKKSEISKIRSFDAEITFRVEDQILTAFSLPSVFSHRSIDNAARVMIRHVDVPTGCNVLELGCGNGAVAMAAAFRSATGDVYAVDCNTRAVDCARRGAEVNGINNLTAILNHDGKLSGLEPCDLALLNPPYYGDFKIAEHFMATAASCLSAGARAWVVTKQTGQYLDREWPGFCVVDQQKAQGYDLLGFEKMR
ncbi:Ribosomal RNA large subunit methyltransferase G [Planctomycetes bacterium CA13]|uniref:Ribosomal RNA large subunit methyltransferase G n=1 Tax=Novipirellula herctigrandis TaxID=2527986 RepID=A0A5C5Z7Z0_9BACT|nr:Ribosomal RNA large subunit methyltransferase G [Planctomycetes bacterium CA13]